MQIRRTPVLALVIGVSATLAVMGRVRRHSGGQPRCDAADSDVGGVASWPPAHTPATPAIKNEEYQKRKAREGAEGV